MHGSSGEREHHRTCFGKPLLPGLDFGRPAPIVAVLVCVLVLLASSSCDDGGKRTGTELHELTGPTFDREVCVPGGRGPDYTIGVATASNTGTEPISISDVELTDARDVELKGADVVILGPDAPIGEFGVWIGSPPRISERDRVVKDVWNRRTKAVGATIQPDDQERANFILHLHGGPDAAAGPIRVTYRNSAGTTGTWTSNVSYAIRSPC